jgi:hypothetical protein
MTLTCPHIPSLLHEPVYTGVRPSRTDYELPPGGISLLGYTVRRMHKTSLLSKALGLAAHRLADAALACVGLYAAGASASFGRAHYQPGGNAVGDQANEPDPDTGATVRVRLLARQPHLRLAAEVRLGDDLTLMLEERILGTQLTWRGLGMPAPLAGRVVFGAYSADIQGHITSELAPGLLQAVVRGVGVLTVADCLGQRAEITLERNGRATAAVTAADGSHHQRVADFAGRA